MSGSFRVFVTATARRLQFSSVERSLPWAWYADRRRAAPRGRADFRPLLAVRGPHWDRSRETGGFFAATAGQIPVVVTRARDGELRAFLNVCRHRGHVVASGSGERETLQCPYHAWTYGLDGRLRAAPRSDREPGFDTDELGLKQIAVDYLGPVRLREPATTEAASARRGARRRAAAARRDRRHRLARVPFPRPSSSSTRTGRSPARTSSSATTAPSRIPGSARRSTSRPTRTGSRHDGLVSSQVGPLRAERQLVSHGRRGASAASSTSSGRTSGSTSSPASRTSPAARCSRSALSAPVASWTTSSHLTSTRTGSTS